MSVRSQMPRWSSVAAAFLLLTCGGKSPTGSTPPPPSPTASPNPTPTPPPVQTLCKRLGYVPTPDTKCGVQAALFNGAVEDAIAKVMREHANYFQNDAKGVLIRNFGAYYVEVIENLDGAGYCAGYDGEELGVKESNDFNEQYKISSAGGFVRHDSYQATCRPAAFPTPEPPPISPPPGCNLRPSHEIACGAATPSYLGDVKAAIDQVVKEHPELFDLQDIAARTTDGYKVRNAQQYHAAVVENLLKRGYCARFDGEEVVIKTSNEFSDHYDILTGDNYIRRGEGEFQVSCYPAAF